MATIDKAALIEAAAEALEGAYARWSDLVEVGEPVIESEHEAMAAAVASVVVAAVLQPLRAQVAEWREFMRDELELTDYERSALRLCASELEHMLDQIEADAKGDER